MKTIGNRIIIGLALLLLLPSCGNKKGHYDASGVFEAVEVLVSSQASGQLVEFNVEEGATLDSGKQAGCIDTTQFYLKKLQLRANLRSVNSRRVDVNKQMAAVKEQIERQKTERHRFENLVKSNAASQKQLDDINAQLAVLEKQLAAGMETLESSNQSISNESASIEIQITQIEDQIRKSIISSPINGVVLSKYAERGEVAIPGKALFRIADINHMFLRAYITSDQLSQLKLADTVKVYADFGEKDRREYFGTITWISDKAEFTPKTIQTRNERANLVYAVKVAVKNDGYLKKGMYGELKLHTE